MDRNEYIKAILFNKVGFLRQDVDPTTFFTVNTAQVTKYYNSEEAKVIFTVPNMDPYGEHRVWYRWAFYNPASTCDEGVDCLGDETVDGMHDPWFYSTYINLTDMFTMDERHWII